VIEAIAADRTQLALLSSLLFGQPAQGLEAAMQNLLLPCSPSAHDQRLGEPCIVVREFFLKPVPVGVRVTVVQLHQSETRTYANAGRGHLVQPHLVLIVLHVKRDLSRFYDRVGGIVCRRSREELILAVALLCA
jgi:hypothetical protein